MVSNTQNARLAGRRAARQVIHETSERPSKLPVPVILYLISIALPVEFKIGPLHMTGVRTLLIAMMIPILIKLILGKYGRPVWTDFLFLLFSIWIIITLFINSPESALSFGGSVAVEFFGGYLLARAYVRSSESMLATYRAIFFVLVFTIPFAIYEGRTGQAFIPNLIRSLHLTSIPDYYHPADSIRLGLERPQVIFSHPIHYGVFGATVFSFIFIGFQNIIGATKRYIASALICLAVFLSLSSGGILPVIVQMGMTIWAFILKNFKNRWYILLILVGILYVIVDIFSNRTPIDVFMSYATFSPHNAYWRKLIFEWGIKNVWSNPVTGIGLNDWVRPWFMYSNSVDNFWLLSAMRYGIPGFLFLAIGFFLPVFQIIWTKIDESTATWNLRRAWVFTILGLALALCTVDVWATVFSYVAFLFGSGIWFLSIDAAKVAAAKPVAKPAKGSRQLISTNQKAARSAASPLDSTSRFTRFDQNQTR